MLKDAINIKEGKGINIWKTGEERDFLMRIRNHELLRDEILNLGKQLLNQLNETKSNIPEEPNIELLNDILIEIRMENLT